MRNDNKVGLNVSEGEYLKGDAYAFSFFVVDEDLRGRMRDILRGEE